jgi:hypothetical protein
MMIAGILRIKYILPEAMSAASMKQGDYPLFPINISTIPQRKSGTSGKAGGLKDWNRSNRLEELRRS